MWKWELLKVTFVRLIPLIDKNFDKYEKEHKS